MGKIVKSIGKAIGSVFKAVTGFVGMLFTGPKVPKASANTSTETRLQASLVPEENFKVIFGETAVGTDMRFWETYGTGNNGHVQVFAAACHEMTAYGNLYLDEKPVTFDGENATGAFAGLLSRRLVLKGVSGSGISLGTGTRWTVNSSMTGCGWYALIWTYDQAKLPNGIPSRVTLVGKGAKVYDPRRDSTRGGSGAHRADNPATWEYSPLDSNNQPIGRNNALQMLAYTLGIRALQPVTGIWKLRAGRGAAPADVNFDSFIAAANACEVEGWYSDCILSTGDSHSTNEGILEAAAGGRLVDTGGRFSYYVSTDDTANIAAYLDEGDIVGDIDWQPAKSMNEQYNELPGTFVDPAALFQTRPLPLCFSQDYYDADGYEKRAEPEKMSSVQDPVQGQKLLRRKLNKSRLQGEFTATFNLRALKVQAHSCIRLTFPKLGFNNKLFRVIQQGISKTGGIQLVLEEDAPAVYLPGAIVTVPAPSVGEGGSTSIAIEVAGLTAVATGVVSGTSGRDAVRAYFTAPPENVVRTEGRYKRTADANWSPLPPLSRGQTSWVIEPLLPTTNYTVEARHITAFNVPSVAWASVSATTDAVTVNPAGQLVYSNGQTVDSLRPGEAGANVTETRTSAFINGQQPWATYGGLVPSTVAGQVQYLGSSGYLGSDYVWRDGVGAIDDFWPQEFGSNVTENRTSAFINGQQPWATYTGRTTASLGSAIDANGYLISGLNSRVTPREIMGGINGTNIAANPEFADGSYAGWSVYNNAGGSKLTHAVQYDNNAPNNSGYRLKIAYDGTGTDNIDPTPGFGGVYQGIVNTSGAARPGYYTLNSRILYKIWASIPTGRTLSYHGNAMGVGATVTALTSLAGTSDWQLYIFEVYTGAPGGSPSSIGHLAVHDGPNTAFDWFIAKFDQIDISGSASTFINTGLRDATGVRRGDGDLITTQGTSAFVNNQSRFATAGSLSLADADVYAPFGSLESVPARLDPHPVYGPNYIRTDRVIYADGGDMDYYQPQEPNANVTENRTSAFFNNQGALATRATVDDNYISGAFANRVAGWSGDNNYLSTDRMVYPAINDTVSSRRPAEFGSNVTENRTAAFINGQQPWATSTVPVSHLTAPGSNILFNGGFRLGLQNWGNGFSGVGEDTYSGRYAVINGTATVISDIYGCQAGTTMVLSGEFFQHQSSTYWVLVFLNDANNYVGEGSYIAPSDGWTRVSGGAFTVPVGATRYRVYGVTASNTGYSLARKIKVEVGSIATPWNDDRTNGALYQTGVNIDSLRPQEFGSNVTESRTSAFFNNQQPWATASVPVGLTPAVVGNRTANLDNTSGEFNNLSNITTRPLDALTGRTADKLNYVGGGGPTMEVMRPQEGGANVTESRTAAFINGQQPWATYGGMTPAQVATPVQTFLTNRTQQNIVVGAGGQRWFRVARVVSSAGRGAARITLGFDGGGAVPSAIVFDVSSDWNTDQGSIAIVSNGVNGPIIEARLSKNYPTEAYFDVRATLSSTNMMIDVEPLPGTLGVWAVHYVDTPTVGANLVGSIPTVGVTGVMSNGTYTLINAAGGVNTNGIAAVSAAGVGYDVQHGAGRAVQERGANITESRTSAFVNGQGALATRGSVDDDYISGSLAFRVRPHPTYGANYLDASATLYNNSYNVEQLRPQEIGANITESRTSAFVNGQGVFATRNSANWNEVVSGSRPEVLRDANLIDGHYISAGLTIYNNSQTVNALRPAEFGSNITENRTSAFINNQARFATASSLSLADADVYAPWSAIETRPAVTQGDSLTEDPAMSDPSSWTLNGAGSFVTVTDGRVARTAYRGTSGNMAGARCVPVDPNKTYLVEGWYRSIGGNTVCYGGVDVQDGSGNTIGEDGTFFLYTPSGETIGTSWVYWSQVFGAGTSRPVPALGRQMRTLFYPNYTGTGNSTEVQGLRIVEVTTVGGSLRRQNGAVATEGALVTNQGTSAFLNGQGAWATASVPGGFTPDIVGNRTQRFNNSTGVADANTIYYTNGQYVDGLRPAEFGSNITENRTSAFVSGQTVLVTNPDYAGITGSTRPANNAGTSGTLTVIGSHTSLVGNFAQKSNTTGTHGSWQGGVVGTARRGSCFISGSVISAGMGHGWLTCYALGDDATSFVDTSQRYRIIVSDNSVNQGSVYMVHPGGQTASFTITNLTPASRATIAYDGSSVKAIVDGIVLISVPAPAGLRLFPKMLDYYQSQSSAFPYGVVDIQHGAWTENTVSNVTLLPFNAAYAFVEGNTLTKWNGDHGSWSNGGGYSRDRYTGSAYTTFTISPNSGVNAPYMMVGLASSAFDGVYNTLNYGIFVESLPSGSGVSIYYSGNTTGQVIAPNGWAITDVWSVVYDGTNVRFLRNGVVFYTLTNQAAGQVLGFGASIVYNGNQITNIQVGSAQQAARLGQNTYDDTGGALVPRGNIMTNLGTSAFVNNQGNLATVNTISGDSQLSGEIANRLQGGDVDGNYLNAARMLYPSTGGATVSGLRPQEAGSNVTENRTASFVNNQSLTATTPLAGGNTTYASNAAAVAALGAGKTYKNSTSGAIETTFPTAPGFGATASNTSRIGTRVGAGSVTTNTVTITPSGQTGSVTYNWYHIGGDASITATAATSATTAFTGSVGTGETKTATFACAASDSGTGQTVTMICTATLSENS